jgi:Zn-dependent M28 family amino/carboxypeptidase
MRRLEALGYTVTLDRFRDDMSANVIAELRASRAEPSAPCIVVGGAHYDSRGANASDPSIRAPGADDNASGSAAMLEIARVLVSAKVSRKCAVRIVLFSGEEQGLLGSRALAARWAAEAEPIVAMVNADMLGYQIPDAEITLGFKDRYVTPELVALATSLVQTCARRCAHTLWACWSSIDTYDPTRDGSPSLARRRYVPTLRTGSSSSCCSDYMSFFENGFAAVGFFENAQAKRPSEPHLLSVSILPTFDFWLELPCPFA